MLKTFAKRALSSPASAPQISRDLSDATGYTLLGGELGGVFHIAFVDPNGASVAVEFRGERASIVTGLAAGVVLTDLHDLVEDAPCQSPTVLSAIASVSIRGAVSQGEKPAMTRDIRAIRRIERASALHLALLIDALPGMSSTLRQQLKGLLQL